MKNINLENIEQFSVSLDEHPLKWIFLDNVTKTISEEHKGQIYALDSDAAKFLWNIESQFKIFNKEFFKGEFFKDNTKCKYRSPLSHVYRSKLSHFCRSKVSHLYRSKLSHLYRLKVSHYYA